MKSIMAAGLALFLSLINTRANIHNANELMDFKSAAEVTNYFHTAGVSFEVFTLKKHGDENLVIAAYPYSGSDTIDIYHFVKFGERWRIKMTFFYLRPKNRELTIRETGTKIILLDKKEEFHSILVDKTLNSLERYKS